MDIQRRVVGGVVILDLEGRMGWGDNPARLKERVEDLVGQERIRILINLKNVPFIDTKGIAELVTSQATVQKQGGQLKLAQPSAYTREVLRVTRLDTVLEVFGSEREALRSFPTDDGDPG